MLDVFTPGGFEGFFAAVAAVSDAAERDELGRRFGMEVVGPRWEGDATS